MCESLEIDLEGPGWLSCSRWKKLFIQVCSITAEGLAAPAFNVQFVKGTLGEHEINELRSGIRHEAKRCLPAPHRVWKSTSNKEFNFHIELAFVVTTT